MLKVGTFSDTNAITNCIAGICYSKSSSEIIRTISHFQYRSCDNQSFGGARMDGGGGFNLSVVGTKNL